MTLVIIPFYAALLALLYLVLTINIVKLRRGLRIGIGHGDSKDLRRAIRVHANFIEYVPLSLILLFAIELNGTSLMILHLCGSGLFIGRILHILGLGRSIGYSPGRFWGSFITYSIIIFSAITNIRHFLSSIF